MKEQEYSLINIKTMFSSFVIHKSCQINVTTDPLSYITFRDVVTASDST